MNYLNDPKAKPMLYQDVVAEVVKLGVPLTRAYLYLAMIGVTSKQTRQLRDDGSGYGEPRKLAVHNGDTLVNNVGKCEHCDSIVCNL